MSGGGSPTSASGGGFADARRGAESAFHDFLAQRRSGKAPDTAAFSAGLEAGVREEFLRILQDYELLRQQEAGTTPLSAASPSGGAELGDFRLLRELGRGGMGVVWEAEQLSLGRKVALKVLYPHLGLSPVWTERFQREAQLAARLSHPGIVAVHAVGEEDGTPYIAQELVPGGRTLADRLQEMRAREAGGAALPGDRFRDMAEVFAAAAEALHAAHGEGIVHRDVKPGNILLHGGAPRIADFGLARLEQDLGLSRTGELLGTPFYMSPEQVAARRLPVDARADVFSLGASLYEALTLRLPFDGDTREQVIGKILLDDPPDPRKLRSRVPRDLAMVCLKALEKTPGRRYASMAEFAADLRRFLSGESVLAKPPGPAARAGKWLRRHPTLTAAGAVALAAFVGLAALFADARAAREEAETEARTAERVEAFLVELLGELSPAASRGEPIDPAEIVLRGAERAREELAEEPVVRATLLMTLGKLSFSLGRYDQAEPLLREALELRSEHIGGEDERTLEAMNQLAHLLSAQGRYEEAEEQYKAAQAGHVRVFGAGSPEDLENRGNLSTLYWRLGRFEEAEALARASLEGVIANWGADHLHALTARGNLAALLVALERFEEAEPMMREVLEERRLREGADSPGALAVLLQYAGLIADLGRAEEADALFRENLDSCLRVFGPLHPSTAGAWHALGRFLYDQGAFEEAGEDFRRAWEIRRAELRPDHPSALASLNNLVRVLHQQGRDAEALPLAEGLVTLTPADASRRAARQELLDSVREAALAER